MKAEGKQKRLIGLLSLGHLVTDMNQGALPALLPFLIGAHDLSYAAAAGIVFAANISSTVVQPVFGHAADRLSRPWLLPAGVVLAGAGLALTGAVPSYGWILAVAVISGVGVAAYHPEAARLVNFAAGDRKATAISTFGVGGALGFAIGPLFATTLLLVFGLRGTLTLIAPAGLMALILAAQLPRLSGLESAETARRSASGLAVLPDRWGPFVRLTLAVICRSILFYGLNTFIPLYWITVLGRSKAAGGAALTLLATAGVFGNLMGGRLADRFGYRKIAVLGFAVLIPLLPALVWTRDPRLALLLLVPIGLGLSTSYSPLIVMGQKYLPQRVGLSSGVTLGIAVAIGGVAAPILGRIADLHGIWTALAGLAGMPVLTVAMTLTLPEPHRTGGSGQFAVSRTLSPIPAGCRVSEADTSQAKSEIRISKSETNPKSE